MLHRRDISGSQREVLLRASWGMLYAHYEGFAKFCLSVFYAEAKQRISACHELPANTRVFAHSKLIKTLRQLPADQFLSAVENFGTNHASTPPEFPDVDTDANLWPNLLIDLLNAADIDANFVEKHRQKLRTLVKRRNGIAHGEEDIIPEVRYYLEFEQAVYEIMYDLAFSVDARLSAPPYGTS
nr:MAE_28990/MAE_18760 family HEPN-like nuclease [Neorhizobium galegae]